jgi:hypothetical protein
MWHEVRDALGMMAYLAAITAFIAWRVWPRGFKGGQGTLPMGYQYAIGDNLTRSDGILFSGIEVYLPKLLPQILLDAHANDHRMDMQLWIARSEQLSLEGNFDKTFQAFAPQEYHRLALSILSPDFMEVLMQSAERYDLEIADDVLRLMTHGGLSRNFERQAAITKAADTLATKLAHRVNSWQPSNLPAHPVRIKVREQGVVKLGRRHYIPARAFWVALLFLPVALGLWAIGVLALSQHFWSGAIAAFVGGFAAYPGMYLLAHHLEQNTWALRSQH